MQCKPTATALYFKSAILHNAKIEALLRSYTDDMRVNDKEQCEEPGIRQWTPQVPNENPSSMFAFTSVLPVAAAAAVVSPIHAMPAFAAAAQRSIAALSFSFN